ncbi:MAG TPA: transporter substrate-binding domain-containing protein [Bacteroidales bacterium]|nr:transporter substrate-binding domain-containing protein [Bacteroidales bacterium]
MKNRHNKLLTFVILLLMALFFGHCRLSTKERQNDSEVDSKAVDFREIKQRGKLVAGVSTNSTDYFVYRGQPMGFQYELLNKFTETHDLKLEIIVENDLIKSMEYLKNRDIDLIAQSLTITPERGDNMAFTEPIAQTRQVLLQRKSTSDDSVEFIRNQLNLAGKTIHIQKGGAAYQRLRNLSEEIADSIHIVEIDSLEMEEIIRLVANGTIDYTVCDENVAIINEAYYNNIDIKTPVSFPQNLAWGLRKESTVLADSINKWLIKYKETSEYKYLYHKYFKSSRAKITRSSSFYSGEAGLISEYDPYIREASKIINWDWRLLASLIYQESRFNPNVTSWAGAFGIMQLMPATADFLGVSRNSSISSQINAGARYIKYLDEKLPPEVSEKEDRVKFILASYNIGPGHINDAIRLAEKYGRNPHVWEGNVRYFLLHKSNPRYYEDKVVKHGYCSGTQPIKYAEEIWDRYEHYKNVIPLS